MRRNAISTAMICIVCILFLSFLLQGNTHDNYKQVNTSNPTGRLQISSSNPPEQQWNTTWGGIGDDYGWAIALDSSSNIFIAGETNSYGAGGDDIVLIKYNSLGEQQWNTTWGGIGDDSHRDIALDSSNNIYITGTYNYTWNPNPMNSIGDILLLKYNSLGEYQWNKTWDGGHGRDIGNAIAVDSTSNIYLVGSGAGVGIVLIKYDSLGEQQWNTTWNPSIGSDIGYAITLDPSGNVFITGVTLVSYPPFDYDMVLAKFNSLGEYQWSITWGGVGYDMGLGITNDPSNNIYITGYTTSYGVNVSLFLVKYNSLGELQWNTTWGGSAMDYGWAIALDSSNNIFVAGPTSSFGAGSRDIVLIKYTGIPDGNGVSPIPGYDLFLLLGAICVVSVILIKKQHKSTASHPTV